MLRMPGQSVIIIDGDCTRAVDGLRCESEIDAKNKGQGFSKRDPEGYWRPIRIPVVMISKGTGRLPTMDLDKV